MSTKTGLVVATTLLALSGLFGMSQLAAIQDGAGTAAGAGDGGIEATDAVTAAAAVAGSDEAEAGARAADVVIEASDDAAIGVRVSTGNMVLEGRTIRFPNANREALNSDSQDTRAERPLKGAFAEFSRRSERNAERDLNLLMAGTDLPEIAYPGEESLAVILQYIADYLTDTTGRKVLILPDVSDPDVGSIDYLKEVNVTDVRIPEGSMTIASAIDLILSQVKDQELTWIVKDEVLMITTAATAGSEENLILRSYDISRLRDQSAVLFSDYPKIVSRQGGGAGGQGQGGGGFFQVTVKPPAGAGAGGTDSAGGGAGTVSDRNEPSKGTAGPGRRGVGLPNPQTLTWEHGLMQVIHEMTSPPCLWIQNGDDIGTLAVAGNRLIVRQTRTGHEAVIEVLDELEDAAVFAEAEAAGLSGDNAASVKQGP